jgi:hypothetical protein
MNYIGALAIGGKIFDYKSNSMADRPTNGEFIALIAEHMSRKKTA